jgi:alanine dehydrogenase
MSITIGLPKLVAPVGFRRGFCPDFVYDLSTLKGVQILLEHGYGDDLRYKKHQYMRNANISFASRNTIFRTSTIILSLTSPTDKDIRKMGACQTLISMLHFPTHPERNELIRRVGLKAISLDSIKDEEGKRMIQDFSRTAQNAITEGFIRLRKNCGDSYWFDRKRDPIMVYLLGFGELGKEAATAAITMGNTQFQKKLVKRKANPFVVVVPTTSIHSRHGYHRSVFNPERVKNGGVPHILVDVSRRKNLSKPIITESDMRLLPPETVIVDISADRYEGESVVKAISGIPTGDEKQCVFSVSDRAWRNRKQIPAGYQLAKGNRRTVVSHYAWPNYGSVKERRDNMKRYADQLFPVVQYVAHTLLHGVNDSDEFESLGKSILEATLV